LPFSGSEVLGRVKDDVIDPRAQQSAGDSHYHQIEDIVARQLHRVVPAVKINSGKNKPGSDKQAVQVDTETENGKKPGRVKGEILTE